MLVQVNPSDAGFYDRVIVQELIKEIASNQPLDILGSMQQKPDQQHKGFKGTGGISVPAALSCACARVWCVGSDRESRSELGSGRLGRLCVGAQWWC